MNARHASDLLYDSEAALRLVDSAIQEIGAPSARFAPTSADATCDAMAPHRDSPADAAVPADPSQRLASGYAAVVSAIGSLRERRATLTGAVEEEAPGCASSVLAEVEGRLVHLASVLDPASSE